MDTLVYVLYILTGFGPSAIIVYFGIRALYSQTGDIRADYGDASSILDWLMPAFAVTAVGIKLRIGTPVEDTAVLSFFQILLTYYAIRFILDVLILRSSKSPDKTTLKDVVRHAFLSQGKSIGILACVMFYRLSQPNSFPLEPSIYLFVAIYFAGYWGMYFADQLRRNSSRVKVIIPKSLEPGELRTRIGEIASSMGLQLTEISIIDDRDFPMTNAAAINLYNDSHVILTHSLVKNLSKDEVDAVIAHEIGHCVDTNCWELSNLYKFGLMLVFLAVMVVAERYINALPASFLWLQYVKWLSLFILPPLAVMWYSRQREHEADANYGILANPQACISGLYKLHLISDTPMSRPVWSKLVSTHPSMDQRIKQIASQYKLTESELENLFESAKADIEDQSDPRYELTSFAEKSSDEVSEKLDLLNCDIDPFPNVNVRIGFMIGGMIQFVVFLFLTMLNISKATPYIIILSFALMLVMMIAPNILHSIKSKRIYADFYKLLLSKLITKYGDMTGESPIIVYYKPDSGEYWQFAWLIIENEELHLFGEINDLTITKHEVLRVNIYNNPEDQDKTVISLDFIGNLSAYRLLIDNPVTAIKDGKTPRSIFQLQKYIKQRVIETDVNPYQGNKPPIKQLLIRGSIAVVILTASLYLVNLIIKLSGLDQIDNLKSAPYIWAVIIIGGVLLSWVFRTTSTTQIIRDAKPAESDDDLDKETGP
ncbi:M48 family metalloprotease [uncultured Desulfobulbus sp.]|uniref:M48 family metallopeptidase n=1 Tax=uncultured Desulfobulbus sp. TaxID=239745 RepID=UPI0029C9A1A8|nr:M48 family metalloprotease [uncultured Desulfobulbus sp.]